MANNKKKKTIIGGIVALSLVAATGVTAGFAWFAANSSVNGNNLDVTCKSNARYLLISTEDNATDKSKSSTKVTLTPPEDNTVYPCSYWNSQASNLTYGDVTIPFRHFYTATVSDPNDPNSSMTSLKEVQLGDPDYFVHYRVYLSLAENSASFPATPYESFHVVATYGANNDDAISAIMTFSWLTGDNDWSSFGTKYSIMPNSNRRKSMDKIIGQPSLTSSTSVYIDMYFFVDGDTSNVYNYYGAKLTGSIGFSFSIVPGFVR